MRRRRILAGGLASVVVTLQGGCAAPTPIMFPAKPELFPPAPAAAEPKIPGRVALVVPPEVQATVASLGAPNLIVACGSIVEQALLLALGAGVEHGVQPLTALPVQGSGFDATLVLLSVRLQVQLRNDFVFSFWLASDVKAVDAVGRIAWTRFFLDNREYAYDEAVQDFHWGKGYQSAKVHEAAWRLAQQVLRDLREWLETERLRPREL